MSERGGDIYSQIKAKLGQTKEALDAEKTRREEEKQAQTAKVVVEAADMVEGNLRLQQGQKESGRKQVRGVSGWRDDYLGWGYADIEYGKKVEAYELNSQIQEEENVAC